MITVITMYRGYDAETFVQAVEGRLNADERRKWRDAHQCDLPGDDDKEAEDINNMFFRELEPLKPGTLDDMLNADQAEEDAV